MALVLVSPPSEPIISLDEARVHLRMDATGSPPKHPEDDLVQSLVAAVTNEIDGRDGWLGRALTSQRWKLTLDNFNEFRIRLPLAPLKSVETVEYVDPSGDLQTLDAGQYRVLTDREPGCIEPIYGGCWPSTRCQSSAVAISYTSGYGTAKDVPELIKAYAKLRLGQLYAQREAVIAGTIVTEMPWVRYMLEGFRLRSNYP